MKKLISRALTLVVIAGTISNTAHCLAPRAINTAVNHEKKVNAANMAVAAARDKGASQEEISKKEEAAKKAADEARTWLDSVKELSISTKVLLGAIATTGALIGVDYAVARYTEGKMGGYTAAGLAKASDYAKPYMESARKKAESVYNKTKAKVSGWNRPAWLGGKSATVAAEEAAAATTAAQDATLINARNVAYENAWNMQR